MIRRVEWFPQAEADLFELPHWRIAEQISKALETFASNGVGFVRLVHGETRLYTGEVYARINIAGDVVLVERVIRWRS